MHPEFITRAEKRELFLTLLSRYASRYKLPAEVSDFFSSDAFLKAIGDYCFDMHPRDFRKQLPLDDQPAYRVRGYDYSKKAIFNDLVSNLYSNAAYVLCELRALWSEGFCCEVYLDKDAGGTGIVS